jgi:hypothetical protein
METTNKIPQRWQNMQTELETIRAKFLGWRTEYKRDCDFATTHLEAVERELGIISDALAGDYDAIS